MEPNRSGARFFVPDLPETTDAMIAGGVYALIAETPPARFPLLATALAGCHNQRMVSTLLLPSTPQVFLERLGATGFRGVDLAVDSGRLQVFQFQDDFAKKMFRFGAEAFTEELDHFGLPANSFLVIDQADELLSLHDMTLSLEQADALGKWARKNKITVLLVFTRVAAMAASLATLTGLMDYLSGIVRLGGHQDGLDLTFEYWQSPDGTIAAKVYRLGQHETGSYFVRKDHLSAPIEVVGAGGAVVETLEPEETGADLRFVYMDAGLKTLAQQVEGRWEQVESVAGAIRSSHGARAPSVLLTFDRSTVLRDLAEAVHTLRLSLGKRARIVVVERDASLRYPNEILLLRLGTSLVIHRDVPEGRLPLMLESLRGQVFTRDIEMDFEAALASVVSSSRRGYVPPMTFARECLHIAERSELLNIPCAMAIGHPIPGSSALEILSHARITRAGDLTTTDGDLCFLFFSGCPETSVKKAIQAAMGDNLNATFVDMQFLTRRDAIRHRLQQLTVFAEGRVFPDTLAPKAGPSSSVTTQLVHAAGTASAAVAASSVVPERVAVVPPPQRVAAVVAESAVVDAAAAASPAVTPPPASVVAAAPVAALAPAAVFAQAVAAASAAVARPATHEPVLAAPAPTSAPAVVAAVAPTVTPAVTSAAGPALAAAMAAVGTAPLRQAERLHSPLADTPTQPAPLGGLTPVVARRAPPPIVTASDRMGPETQPPTIVPDIDLDEPPAPPAITPAEHHPVVPHGHPMAPARRVAARRIGDFGVPQGTGGRSEER